MQKCLLNILLKLVTLKSIQVLIRILVNYVKKLIFFPFYIDLIIKELDINREIVNKENIAKEVEKLISSPGKPGTIQPFF